MKDTLPDLFAHCAAPLPEVKKGKPSRQNRSTAVMQARKEPRDSLDDFPTPPWGTRALCEALRSFGYDLADKTVREPAANRGFMVRPLAESFGRVIASDVADYGGGYPLFDYIRGIGPIEEVDWTITNPPFCLAPEFLQRARQTSRIGAAFLLRIAFLEGTERFDRIYRDSRPAYVLQFSERLPMFRRRMCPTESTATAYAWFIWRFDTPALHCEMDWIAPSRKRLERPDDYPGYWRDGSGIWRK